MAPRILRREKGISNDNAGENPARRKIKDSPAMSIIRG